MPTDSHSPATSVVRVHQALSNSEQVRQTHYRDEVFSGRSVRSPAETAGADQQ